MRLLSLRLSNFKGIESRLVEFRPTGMTVIQGPNEVGKTSLMHAFDILLEYADSSQHREVEATQSSGQDRSTEIEAQFEIRGEHFTYFKRYHRDRETRLVIESGGQRRTVAGREAHDRVREVLTQTTDGELWKALKMVQGLQDAGAHVALGGSKSLRDALDRAAGGGEGTADDTLFHRVKRERDAYYSPKGQELKPVFGGLRERVAALQHAIEQFNQEIARVETDTDRIDFLDREIQNLHAELAEVQSQLRVVEEAMESVQALESEHRDALQALREIQDRLSDLIRQWTERSRYTEQEAKLTKDLIDLENMIQEARKEDTEAQHAVGAERAQYEAAQAERAKARQVLDRVDEDAAALLTRTELATLEKTLERVQRLLRDKATWEAQRSRIHVTEEGLKAIRKQGDKVHHAQSALEVGSPTATIRALGSLAVTVNGSDTPFVANEAKQFSVSEPMVIGIPTLVDITLTPGASVPDLQAKLDREQHALQEFLDQYHLASVNDAQTQWDLWRDLSRQMMDGQHQLEEALQDSPVVALVEHQDILRARVDHYRANRPDDYSYPETREMATQRVKNAQEAMDEAEEALRLVMQGFEGAKARALSAQKALHALGEQRVKMEGQSADIAEQMATMRRQIPDQDLKRQRDVASDEVEQLKVKADTMAQQVEQRQPQQVRARAGQLGIQVNNVTTRLHQLRQERAEIQGRLATMGAAGLYEEREEALAAQAKLRADVAALERRAQAAKMLYEIVSACRDAEQRRYREPLRQRITELGQVVFGRDFDVALDENLSVISRTLHGITLAIEALSTGAQEQLALLVRLAAASLVDPAEGVPIILDDTLGHTDDERLDLMAAVFAAVAKDCQIILLTCATRRYTKFGQAHVIDLWRGPTVGATAMGH